MTSLLGHALDATLDATLDFGASVPISCWIETVVACLVAGLLYYFLVLPINWIRDLSDVGFDSPDSRSRGKSRLALMKEAQRRRRIGNLPPVYPNGWFSLLESSTLGVGSVKHVAALGQNFAVFRGESGQVHVLDAYCPHMGANMAVGGSVSGDCLECPFHSWRFSGEDGKCKSVPYSQKLPEFAKVHRWDSIEQNGYVFVWHHAEGESPTWTVQPVANVQDGSWTYVGRNEFLVSCHVQEIPENGADVAHLNVVHGPGLAGSGLSQHIWAAEWAPNSEDGMLHTATMRLNHQLSLFGKFSVAKMDVRAEQIGPGYVELYIQTQLGPIVILQTVTPMEPLLQKVVHRMYCPPLLMPYAKFVLFGECVMFERDMIIWNHKKFEDKPMLVKEDRMVLRYRRWFSQFYTENSPKHTFQKETLEW